ncbi:MAG: RraA family protein [Alicyclobacillus herbarius]|uniref:RraA family protein n=1 Tax=Alicyclobacillus herbarius TaxID=122960 RepID=UPI002352D971|nr:RraA family protein [Alicyclobacillus herbarius]MCL6632569.1 RraA family protein [Alicyclobacillus herbarius]
MSSFGFRILPVPARPRPELIEAFRDISTPLISDNLNRMYGCSAQLRAFHPSTQLLGVAITVKTRPGDNLLVHKALDLASEGDVIVVDAGGDVTNAIVGEIMMTIALHKGIRGFVIDGAIRDVRAFIEADFPVYARGITHRGPYKDGPGEINVPVSVCGMTVVPGSIIVGDADGVVAIPPEAATSVLDAAIRQQQREKGILADIKAGTLDRTWVDQTLRQKGC